MQFKNAMAFTGTSDELVYYYHPGLDRILCRKYVKPKMTENNRRIGLVSKKLKSLCPSEGYIMDLKVYVAMYNRRGNQCLIMNWQNAFTKLMYAMAKAYAIDLLAITKDAIYVDNLPCISVRSAVAAGLLPVVEGYERLDKTI